MAKGEDLSLNVAHETDKGLRALLTPLFLSAQNNLVHFGLLSELDLSVGSRTTGQGAKEGTEPVGVVRALTNSQT